MDAHSRRSVRLKTEVPSTTEQTLGGVKEVIFEVKGRNAYGAQVRVWEIHCAARSDDRVDRAHPYLDGHRCGASRRRGGGRDPRSTPADARGRRLSLHPSWWPIGEYDPTRPLGLPTSLPVWSCRARTRSPNSRTKSGPSAFYGPDCTISRRLSRTFNWRPSGAARWAPVTELRKSAHTILPQGRVTDHRVGLTSHRLDAVSVG